MAAEIATTKPGAKTGWWFQTCLIFPFYFGMMIQSDELHHFSEGLKPPSRKMLGRTLKGPLGAGLASVAASGRIRRGSREAPVG